MFYKSKALRNLTSWTLLATMTAMPILSGCSSSTTIHSEPAGARLYVDGQYIGETPARYSDTSIVGTSHSVRLTQEGYKDIVGRFSRNGDLNVGALIGGIFVFVPFLWVLDYEDSYHFQLENVTGSE